MFKSVIISLLVVTTVWLFALFQPQNVYADLNEPNTERESISSINQQTAEINANHLATRSDTQIEIINISGTKLNIQLSDIKIAWQQFKENQALHKQLSVQPKAIYVLYNNFTDSFQQADVTIGYDVNELSQDNPSTLINLSSRLSILPSGRYTEQQIQAAWQQVDYGKPLKYILEVHNLNPTNTVESTKMFVAYK